MKVRVSLGTLAKLGLTKAKVDETPNIAYVMQYSDSGCYGACQYCSQSLSSRSSRELLSRVLWPSIEFNDFLKALEKNPVERVCLQTILKDGFLLEAHKIVEELGKLGVKISLSITPVSKAELLKFKVEGVDYVGVGLDAASSRVFHEMMKPYSWELYWKFIKNSIEVLGDWHVVTHVIIGLGETLEELLDTLVKLRNLKSLISVFAFTPVKGTPLEKLQPPPLKYYRLVQVAVDLILKGLDPSEFLVFDGDYRVKSEVLKRINFSYDAFLTRGCPGCNRPYYNERPGKEPYNFPSVESIEKFRESLEVELRELKK